MQQRWWRGLADKKEDDETSAIVLGASLSQNSHNSFFVIAFLQWPILPSVASSCNSKKTFFYQESFFFVFFFFFLFYFLFPFFFRGLLGLLLPRGFGCRVFFIKMVLSLCPLSIWNTLYPRCSGLYTWKGRSKHVKNVHPPTSLISQASQVIFIFASILPSCVSPWFYSFYFLGLASGSI